MRQGHSVKLSDCLNEKERIRWLLDEVKFVDLSNWGPWIVEKLKLSYSTAQILRNVDRLLKTRNFIPVLISDSVKIRNKLSEIT